MARRRISRGAGSAGFTLVELVAVIAIFSIVAVMSVQALSGGLRLRSALAVTDARAVELARALALLRHDLSALIPMAFTPEDGAAEPAVLVPAGGGRLALSLGGQPRQNGAPEDGLARVVWELDREARLTRRVWTGLTPARADPPAVPMLEGVTRLDIRATTAEGAELRSWPPPDGGSDTRLPRAIEMVIETDAFGTLRVLVAR